VRFPPGNWVAPAGSSRSGGGGNEAVEASDAKGRPGRPREQAGRNASEHPTRPRKVRRGRRPICVLGKADVAGDQGTGWNTPAHERSDPASPPGVQEAACRHRETLRNTGSPPRWWRVTTDRTPVRDRPDRAGVAERLVVPSKPGNAGGGKGPQFKAHRRKRPTARRLAQA
jgi:hypothetical protein